MPATAADRASHEGAHPLPRGAGGRADGDAGRQV